jgi:hypothetical protein
MCADVARGRPSHVLDAVLELRRNSRHPAAAGAIDMDRC